MWHCIIIRLLWLWGASLASQTPAGSVNFALRPSDRLSSSKTSNRLKVPTTGSIERLGHFGGIIPLLYQLRIRAPVTYNATGSAKHLIRFQGRLRMEFIATEMINVLYLHAKELDIEAEGIRVRPLGGVDWLPVEGASVDKEAEVLMVRLGRNLMQHTPYELLVPEFSGEVRPGFSMGVFRGFVQQTSERFYYVTATQFQLTAARTAFPCVDEPFFKANLSLTLVHPPNSQALGNMEPRLATRLRQSGWKETRLAVTPKLPTYTMGFVVLPDVFRRLTRTSDSGLTLTLHFNPFKVEPELAEELMSYVEYSVNAFTRYFNHPLQLRKIDFVMLPEFVVQGMENFGMITLSEDYLVKQKPAYRLSLIAHEMAHQWFSNAVTVRGWREICFQEGITDHYARVVVSSFFPQSNDWDAYIIEKYVTGMIQETNNSPPESLILPGDTNLSQVSGRCFGKGVFVMNGMAQLTGSEAFRSRVAAFLKRHSDDLYSMEDFAAFFDDVKVDGDKSVSDYLHFWFRTGGYPSIFVKRDYAGGTVNLKQEHLHMAGRSFRTLPNVFPIPLRGRFVFSHTVHLITKLVG